MNIFKLLTPVFLIFLIAACSKSEDAGSPEQASEDQSQMEQSDNTAGSSSESDSEHFLSGQQRALEKAKGVESMLQQTDEKRRKEIE